MQIPRICSVVWLREPLNVCYYTQEWGGCQAFFEIFPRKMEKYDFLPKTKMRHDLRGRGIY